MGNWFAPVRPPISQGMSVRTATERAQAARSEAFDRILHNHLLYCTVCDNNNGDCVVHNTAKMLDVDHQTLPFEPKPYAVDQLEPVLPLRSRPVHSLRPMRRSLPESRGQRDSVHSLGGCPSAGSVGWRRGDRRIELRFLRPLRHGLSLQRAHGEIHARPRGFHDGLIAPGAQRNDRSRERPGR